MTTLALETANPCQKGKIVNFFQVLAFYWFLIYFNQRGWTWIGSPTYFRIRMDKNVDDVKQNKKKPLCFCFFFFLIVILFDVAWCVFLFAVV